MALTYLILVFYDVTRRVDHVSTIVIIAQVVYSFWCACSDTLDPFKHSL